MTVVATDPREATLAWLRPILPTILPGWTAGARVPANPSNFVLIKILGGEPDSPISDQVSLAFQFWGTDGLTDDHARTRAARIVGAHARRGINGRPSVPIPLPDPANPERYITQTTITARFRGVDE